MENNYAIEMLHITKEFPGIKANDDVTIQLKKGEIHALLGENGAGKSTLMSILFGLYQTDSGIIKKDGKEVKITDPNVATSLHIGMVHQHFKLVEVYSVLDNIILGDEPIKEYNFSAKNKVLNGFLKGFSKTMTFLNKHIFKVIDRKKAYDQVVKLSNQYGLFIEPNAKVQDITVGMQQRVEILKMLYRENDVLIFDEPTAVLTPQEISELMEIMKKLASEGKSILFITHKLNEIKKVADRCTVLRKGRCIGTVDVANVTKEELSEMMVGRKVQLIVDKTEAKPKDVVLKVENLVIIDKLHKTNAVNNVSFDVRKGEIVCIAGIDGNGQTDLVYGITGLEPIKSGKVYLNNVDITNLSIRKRNKVGLAHIPEDRHRHGLVLDYSLEQNLVLQNYFEDRFQKAGFIKFKNIRKYADDLIEKFDIRSGQGSITVARSMSGGNQQKAIVAREIDRNTDLLIAVQPTRGLDVGAIENIHSRLVELRDADKAVLLVSLELDEVMSLSDRILVMHKGEIVGEFNSKEVTAQELGLYMAGAKKQNINKVGNNNE
ncbi:MAG TPA: heme ABC transporter ATP-binding protein [Acholeplasmatales bacterium]|nr:heme ABC transporter ATP-binding protein [Acholeplasmatales bacterium]